MELVPQYVSCFVNILFCGYARCYFQEKLDEE